MSGGKTLPKELTLALIGAVGIIGWVLFSNYPGIISSFKLLLEMHRSSRVFASPSSPCAPCLLELASVA